MGICAQGPVQNTQSRSSHSCLWMGRQPIRAADVHNRHMQLHLTEVNERPGI